MIVTNANNVKTGTYSKLKTALLLGECNTESKDISIQISFVEPGGQQDMHKHPQSQCYYILKGEGEMIVGDENKVVAKGEAIFIPRDTTHGIINKSNDALTYLTANQAFGKDKECEIWKD